MVEVFWCSLLFGGIAGLIAGIFGIGGGVILVPFFVWLFADLPIPEGKFMVVAIATSLATIIVTALAATLMHHRMNAVLWDAVFRLAPGILIGSAFGAILADFLPQTMLKTVFAGYLYYVSLNMALQMQPRNSTLQRGRLFYCGSGLLIGILSAILGIGGGTLTVPVLVKSGVNIRKAVAISSACGLPIAVAGTLSYAVLGWQAQQMGEGFIGYIYFPAFLGIVLTSVLAAPLGAKLTHTLPKRLIKKLFSVLLFIVATRMMFT